MKVSRILLLVVASMFIFIGALHLWVHFTEMISPSYQQALTPEQSLMLMGETADIWKLWQGFSFLMGIGFIWIGLSHWIYLYLKISIPSIATIVSMIGLLLIIIYAGFMYLSMMQVYGGAFGVLLLLIALGFRFAER